MLVRAVLFITLAILEVISLAADVVSVEEESIPTMYGVLIRTLITVPPWNVSTGAACCSVWKVVNTSSSFADRS